MAKIVKRMKKDGTCSYCIRVSNGYDRQGRQVLVNRTFTPPLGLTGKKLERELKRQRAVKVVQTGTPAGEDGRLIFGGCHGIVDVLIFHGLGIDAAGELAHPVRVHGDIGDGLLGRQSHPALTCPFRLLGFCFLQ